MLIQEKELAAVINELVTLKDEVDHSDSKLLCN